MRTCRDAMSAAAGRLLRQQQPLFRLWGGRCCYALKLALGCQAGNARERETGGLQFFAPMGITLLSGGAGRGSATLELLNGCCHTFLQRR